MTFTFWLGSHLDNFVLPPLVQTPTLKLGGRGEGKTWFKFSGVLYTNIQRISINNYDENN